MGLGRGGKRGDPKATGRHLTNRRFYNYFKDSSIVKSHKLGGVGEKHFVSLEFTGDVADPNNEAANEDFHKYLRSLDGPISSESIGRQSGESDVCDSTDAMANRNRAP